MFLCKKISSFDCIKIVLNYSLKLLNALILCLKVILYSGNNGFKQFLTTKRLIVQPSNNVGSIPAKVLGSYTWKKVLKI